MNLMPLSRPAANLTQFTLMKFHLGQEKELTKGVWIQADVYTTNERRHPKPSRTNIGLGIQSEEQKHQV